MRVSLFSINTPSLSHEKYPAIRVVRPCSPQSQVHGKPTANCLLDAAVLELGSVHTFDLGLVDLAE